MKVLGGVAFNSSNDHMVIFVEEKDFKSLLEIFEDKNINEEATYINQYMYRTWEFLF